MKGGRALMNSQSSTPQLYRQIRRILMVSISVTIILALGVSLWLSLRQDARMRDQTLLSGAQTVASAPELVGSQDPNVRMDYIERMVKNVPYIDIFAVYDPDGIPITFYDLATGTSDPADVLPLSQEILGHFEAGNDTLLYNYEAPEGADRCAYATVYADDGSLIGFVMAAIYMRSIRSTVVGTLLSHILVAIGAMLTGSLLSLRLTRRIKEELLGYEPDVFRQLFLQRTVILDALEEGLLSIDVEGNVTYINRATAEILKIPPQEALGQPLRAIYPRSTIARVMETGRAEYNVNLESIKHVAVISDRMPLWRGGKIEGAVAIFRNRTEVTRLAQDLTGVQHIVEALRSYTHEFTNKLHVILGLLQLGETKQAEEYVLRITQTRAQSIGFISERIKEPSVAALLVGKAYRAAELGIRFDLDPASTLSADSQFLPAGGLITVLGNLIENAFDAFRASPSGVLREVTVSIREGAHGLLMSVDDTGPGIAPDVMEHIFDRGYSTKGKDRGTGLALVRNMVDTYHGTIRVESEPGVGTSFIVTISEPAAGLEE